MLGEIESIIKLIGFSVTSILDTGSGTNESSAMSVKIFCIAS